MKLLIAFFTMFFINISFAIEYLGNDNSTSEELKNIQPELISFLKISENLIEKIIATDIKNVVLVKLYAEKISPRDPVYIKYMVNEKAMIDGDLVVQGTYGLKTFDDELLKKENKKYLEKYLSLDKNEANRISIDNVSENEQTIIYVFTDTSCGYCRKYYNEVDDLNKAGITVKHIPYPRAFNQYASYDEQAPSFYQISNTLCVDDGSSLLKEYFNKTATNPKLDKNKSNSCYDLTKTGFFFGQNVGVTGTPGTLLEDGSFVSGYIQYPQLIRILKGKKLLK